MKDDGRAGDAYGGSKARKLEPLLADALARGARHVVTSGSISSNHALATAVHARAQGLACTLLLLPAPRSPEVRPHLLAGHALGARLVAARRSDVHDPESARRRHGIDDDAVFLPLGGSSALGNLGYVNAGFELAEQVEAGQLPEPRHAFVAAGTGGAAAGLAVGLAAAGLRTRLVAVQTSSTATRGRIERAAAEVIALLRSRDPSFPAARPTFDHEPRFLGPGYGRPSSRGDAAIATAADSGLALDSTYTGKAFAALLARSVPGPTLFWNTWDRRAVPHAGVTARDLPPRIRSYLRAR